MDDDHTTPSSLLDLPDHLLHYICENLDRFNTGCLSSSCRWLNQVCSMHAHEIHVPLQSAPDAPPPPSFFCCLESHRHSATQPSPSPSPSPCDCSVTHRKAAKWPSIKTIVIAGPRLSNPSQFHSLLQQLSSLFRLTTSLTLTSLKLTQPLPLFILQSIPTGFPNLESYRLADVNIGCPASYSKWDAVGSLLGKILHFEGTSPVPGQIDSMVMAHEERMHESGGKNVLVVQELCRSISTLHKLKRLVLTGHKTIHLHNLALSQLTSCTRLEHLEMTLPSVWPFVTARSIQELPSSLSSLTLHTNLPATYSFMLKSGLRRNRPLRCHIHASYGETVYPGFEKWREQSVEGRNTLARESRVARFNGTLDPFFTFLGPSNISLGPSSDTLGSWNDLETPLGYLPSLVTLSIKSSSPDLDPLGLNMFHLNLWKEQQRSEYLVIKSILLSLDVNELEKLILSNLGPEMMTSLEEDHLLDGLSLESLTIGCHNNLLPTFLLSRYRLRSTRDDDPISLSLNVRGVTRAQIESLINLAAIGTSQGPLMSQDDSSQSLIERLSHAAIDSHDGSKRSFLYSNGCDKLARLKELHVQKSPEITNVEIVTLFTGCPSLHTIHLSSCRSISTDVIETLGRMKRRLRLTVDSCRLIDGKSWLRAVSEVSRLNGVVVLDVTVPRATADKENVTDKIIVKVECCSVEFGP